MTENNHAGNGRPAWVSNTLYPFVSRYFQSRRGRIHYVDEGEGRPLVFLHGNPSWSFEYRHLIKSMRGEYRCIALDHLGFGLSGRSADPANHHPAAHAENFVELMDHLQLSGVTLAFSDWGGPIAIDFARKHPERVAGLVILNSWCWPVNHDRHFVRFSGMMSSKPMQFLIKRFNFFVKVVTPKAVGNRAILTKEVMAHYENAQPNPAARAASAAFPVHIVGASAWLGDIWDQRAAFADIPALAVWGLKDIAFRRQELETWQAAMKHCEAYELPDCGHFLAEEAPAEVAEYIRGFMTRIGSADCKIGSA